MIDTVIFYFIINSFIIFHEWNLVRFDNFLLFFIIIYYYYYLFYFIFGSPVNSSQYSGFLFTYSEEDISLSNHCWGGKDGKNWRDGERLVKNERRGDPWKSTRRYKKIDRMGWSDVFLKRRRGNCRWAKLASQFLIFVFSVTSELMVVQDPITVEWRNKWSISFPWL